LSEQSFLQDFFVLVFFSSRRRHTIFSRDWSSDVCSSDLFTSGMELGRRIAELVDEGPVVGFIATPGQLNIQPRIDGARQAIKESGKNIQFDQIATGAQLPEELSRIDAYY